MFWKDEGRSEAKSTYIMTGTEVPIYTLQKMREIRELEIAGGVGSLVSGCTVSIHEV